MNNKCNDLLSKKEYQTYKIGNSTFTVRREFEDGKTTMLEQILSMLLDMMEKNTST